MKVSGFSFVRNAVKLDYPVVESIMSILPMVEEFVISVGKSDDGTLEMIRALNEPKIKIIESIWDDSLRSGGRVLAVETDKALAAIDPKSDWAFYIQADEIVHEQYHTPLRKAMEQHLENPKVEGLLLHYHHFYGSYDYVGDSRKWYRNEIRIIRNIPGMHSFRDAQGFRINNKLIHVKQTDGWMYHYGWVKPPDIQQRKHIEFNKLWHSDDWVKKNIPETESCDYSKIDSLKKFEGSHPKVMKKRIQQKNWNFDFDPTKKDFGLKARILHLIEQKTGWRPGEYKNYIKI